MGQAKNSKKKKTKSGVFQSSIWSALENRLTIFYFDESTNFPRVLHANASIAFLKLDLKGILNFRSEKKTKVKLSHANCHIAMKGFEIIEFPMFFFSRCFYSYSTFLHVILPSFKIWRTKIRQIPFEFALCFFLIIYLISKEFFI